MATKVKNSWWMKPLNVLYRRFGIVVMTIRDTPDMHWGIYIFKARRESRDDDRAGTKTV